MAPLMASGHRPYIPMPQGRGFTDAMITAPYLRVDRTVEPAIVASFQGVHDYQGDTAPMLAFIPGLATFLLPSAGALGFASVSRTPTGLRFLASFTPTFVEFGLCRRWRCFAIDLDDEDIAIVTGALSLLHIGHAIFTHADDELLDSLT